MEVKPNKYAYNKEYYERGRDYFTSGSAARKLKPVPQNELPNPARRPDTRPTLPRKKPKPRIQRVSRIDKPMLLTTAIAMVITLCVCIGYLEVQSNLVQMNKAIRNLTVEINSLRDKNNAMNSEFEAKLDLEYMYTVAVEEFGMVYPIKNEVISYKKNDTGYVRQYEPVPKSTVTAYFDRKLP